MPLNLLRRLSALALVALPFAQPAVAQGLFSPAITVNDQVITGYEIEQRKAMLRLLRAPGDPERTARDQLIDDRLRIEASAAAGIEPGPDEIAEGMNEFAQRANLTGEEFIKALAGGGVAEQTFRDFVKAGLAWRQLIQTRYGGRANPSEEELNRALSSNAGQSNIRVLLSEIIMPAPPGQDEEVLQRAAQLSQLKTEGEFSAAARRYSATPTKGAGGRLPWRNLSDLPPALRPLIVGLAPGEVTDPLPLPNAVALFQLRAIEETGFTAPEVSALEYTMYYMPGGRSAETLARARVLSSKVDRCDDLYAVAKGQPAEVLERVTLPVAQVPNDIAIELSKLDPGEVSTVLTRNNGQTLVFLMLCGRTLAVGEDADLDQLALGLRNQRLGALADSYLAQLRSEARIVER